MQGVAGLLLAAKGALSLPVLRPSQPQSWMCPGVGVLLEGPAPRCPPSSAALLHLGALLAPGPTLLPPCSSPPPPKYLHPLQGLRLTLFPPASPVEGKGLVESRLGMGTGTRWGGHCPRDPRRHPNVPRLTWVPVSRRISLAAPGCSGCLPLPPRRPRHPAQHPLTPPRPPGVPPAQPRPLAAEDRASFTAVPPSRGAGARVGVRKTRGPGRNKGRIDGLGQAGRKAALRPGPAAPPAAAHRRGARPRGRGTRWAHVCAMGGCPAPFAWGVRGAGAVSHPWGERNPLPQFR